MTGQWQEIRKSYFSECGTPKLAENRKQFEHCYIDTTDKITTLSTRKEH